MNPFCFVNKVTPEPYRRAELSVVRGGLVLGMRFGRFLAHGGEVYLLPRVKTRIRKRRDQRSHTSI